MQGEVLELLKGAGRALQLVVIAGGLRSPPVPRDHHSRAELRYRKAKAFHNKVGSLCRYLHPYEGVGGVFCAGPALGGRGAPIGGGARSWYPRQQAVDPSIGQPCPQIGWPWERDGGVRSGDNRQLRAMSPRATTL